MTDSRDPVAPFDPSVVAAVADEAGLDASSLHDLVRRHQAGVRELPGVDDLVYEWRRGLPFDPVVARTDAAYYLVVPETVWAEFDDHLALGSGEREALREVHDRQTRARAADLERVEGVPDGTAPMVLTRP